MRILLVTQMWPTPGEPELGSFLLPLVRELETPRATRWRSRRSAAAADRRRSTRGWPRDAVRAARRTRPDVVFAHFLFPAGAAGLAAARAARVPLVVMAHGTDVANCERAALRAATAARSCAAPRP